MSNETKKRTGWNADEVLQEMRDHDHAEDWPSDVSTLTRWADVLADLIAERDALRETVRLFADDAQRYHWLRSRNELTAGVDPRGPWVTCDDETCSQYPVGAEIDAAIDAARANEST